MSEEDRRMERVLWIKIRCRKNRQKTSETKEKTEKRWKKESEEMIEIQNLCVAEGTKKIDKRIEAQRRTEKKEGKL